jgi:hypothetical protein
LSPKQKEGVYQYVERKLRPFSVRFAHKALADDEIEGLYAIYTDHSVAASVPSDSSTGSLFRNETSDSSTGSLFDEYE